MNILGTTREFKSNMSFNLERFTESESFDALRVAVILELGKHKEKNLNFHSWADCINAS